MLKCFTNVHTHIILFYNFIFIHYIVLKFHPSLSFSLILCFSYIAKSFLFVQLMLPTEQTLSHLFYIWNIYRPCRSNLNLHVTMMLCSYQYCPESRIKVVLQWLHLSCLKRSAARWKVKIYFEREARWMDGAPNTWAIIGRWLLKRIVILNEMLKG